MAINDAITDLSTNTSYYWVSTNRMWYLQSIRNSLATTLTQTVVGVEPKHNVNWHKIYEIYANQDKDLDAIILANMLGGSNGTP